MHSFMLKKVKILLLVFMSFPLKLLYIKNYWSVKIFFSFAYFLNRPPKDCRCLQVSLFMTQPEVSRIFHFSSLLMDIRRVCPVEDRMWGKYCTVGCVHLPDLLVMFNSHIILLKFRQEFIVLKSTPYSTRISCIV